MKNTHVTILILLMVPTLLYSQSGNINNMLGSGGTFTIKDGSNTFMTLSQSDGYLNLVKSLKLPVTTGSTVGVIYKGSYRFIHDCGNGTNTFVGMNSGNFTLTAGSATDNTGVGNSSLASLTSGSQNCAFGSYALGGTSTPSGNCAFGYEALAANTFGALNSAFGSTALGSNSTGSDNVAVGRGSLYNSSANAGNVAVGSTCLCNLWYTTGSDYNTAIGTGAGSTLTKGTDNILIGHNALPSGAQVDSEITLGNGGIKRLRCQQISITSLSDARDKRNIQDLSLGLHFLMSIKPRSFHWDRRDWYKRGKSDGSKMEKKPTAGFVAQELDQAQTKADAEWLNLVLKSNPERLEATPGNLLPVMVKAIQELKNENDVLKNELVALRASIAEQVKKEVKAALLKAVQQEDTTTKVSLNDTRN